jgi:hypothetical protein
MSYEKTMQMIRRATYRMKVKQEGGKFIEVIDGNELDLREQLERKAEYDMYIYNRYNGYSGFDEFPETPDKEEADLA